MINPKQIFSQTASQLSASMDKLLNLPDSKNFNKSEQKELISSLAAFQHTMKKSSRAGFVPPELKDINREFEKANFDITRMPREYANSLKRTYEDLSEVVNNNPGYFKDRASKAYCDAYELFTGVKFKNFVTKIKNSKTFKKFTHSGESYNITSAEGIDVLYSDLSRENNNEQSLEFDVLGIKAALSGATTSFNTLTGSVNALSSIVIVAIVIISIMIICICIMSAMYQERLVSAIEAITDKQNKTDKKLDKSAIAMSMEESMSSTTNAFLVKPTIGCTKFINKLTEPKEFTKLSKHIDAADKAPISRESYEQSEEFAIPPLNIAPFLAGIVSTVGAPILIGAGVIAGLILAIHLIRGAIYWVGHFRLKISTILKEQSEVLDTNVISLIDKANDPMTPKSEKERLNKIIERQKNMSKNLTSLSDTFYKTQNAANSDAAYDLKDDSKIDFDKVADETIKQAEDQEGDQAVNDVIVNSPVEEPSGGSASIIF